MAGTKIKAAILFAATLLLLTGVVFFIIRDQETETMQLNKTGNTTGNINNGGIAAIQGKWIYYNDDNDSSSNIFDGLIGGRGQTEEKLYKIRTNGRSRTYLGPGYIKCINVVGDYVYYTNENGLAKIRTDGKDLEICNERDLDISYMIVEDEWIYYCGNPLLGLCKMKTDGSTNVNLTKDISWSINVVDDWIYYCGRNEDESGIFKVKKDGNNRTKISDAVTINMIVSEGYIYYNNEGVPSNLYKINMDGSEVKKISSDDMYNFNLSGNKIFYSNLSDYGKLYSINTDGSEKSKIIDNTADKINILNDWIFYENKSISKPNLFKVRIDGSKNQKVK